MHSHQMEQNLKLNIKLLRDDQFTKYHEDYRSCYNARGLYDSMQFVLRLRPDIHTKLDQVSTGIDYSGKYDFETIQAFSTYLHETIHWWQHIGSTSGLILSFTYPAQAHINNALLSDYLNLTGLVKPIVQYNELNAKEFEPIDEEFITINKILNNFHDIEFFKILTINPKSAHTVVNDKLFESLGHSFHIAYSSFINLISSSFDPDLKFLPKADKWPIGFRALTDNKITDHYYGSPVYLSPIGLIDIFEGQARFTQIQYLYFASGKKLSWEDFEELGMLSDVYYSAFEAFLELTGSKRPKGIGDPLIALYLLVLDISMNPSNGFPFDIKNYDSFVDSVDSGKRFISICNAIREKHPELKSFITTYSSSEYYEAATKISVAIGSHSPIDIAQHICKWAKTEKTLIDLMIEESTFDFSEENQPIRLLFSRFIRFQEDKLNHPAYFCWTGFYSAGEKATDESLKLFLEHQSLFVDKADGDIYPRSFPDKDELMIQKAFDLFYTWVSTYDLCRQWIVGNGDFTYDYFWLSSKYSMGELESWARNNFKLVFGVDPNDFSIVKK